MSANESIRRFRSRLSTGWEQGVKPNVVENIGGSHCSHCSHDLTMKEMNRLILFVEQCCIETGCNAYHVIVKLLSNSDKQDIILGRISEEELRVFIKSWIALGQPLVSCMPTQGQS